MATDECKSSTEITRDEALRLLLSDQSLSDLILTGTDGTTVACNKCLLSARSEVFHALLSGKFAEAQSSTVSIGYKGNVLKVIVEYIYTDTSQILEGSPSDTSAVVEWARTLTAVIDAANYFNLPCLRSIAENCARKAMEIKKDLACVFLSETGHLNATNIGEVAINVIRENPEELLSSGSTVGELTPSLLESIVSDKKIKADEKTIFLILQSWAENGDAIEGLDRKTIASEMTKHLYLELIAPSDIISIVTPSGLISPSQLLEAYKSQALQAEKRSRISSFRRKRGVCSWEGIHGPILKSVANTHACYFLDVPPILSGVHKWRVKVLEIANFTWLGVACIELVPDHADWLGKQTGGWVYGDNGSVCHATGRDNGPYDVIHPTFGKGSLVNFTLNLNEETGGTLKASVGPDGPEILLFDNMLSQLGGRGLVPAVSLKLPGEVEILDFAPL